MNPLLRWIKFNAVGVLGMGVQLAALAGFNRLFAGHYLLATGAALEVTLLHNFCWHHRFTFRDRPTLLPAWKSLARFHLSNGLISLTGNLLLMRLLVHGGHFPLLVANAVAIAICSIANFTVGTHWVFSVLQTKPATRSSLMKSALLLPLTLATAVSLHAQVQPTSGAPGTAEPALPLEAVATPHTASPTLPRESPSDSYFYRMGALCGTGVSTSSAATKPTFGCGVGSTLVPIPIFIELGVMGPQANRSYLTGYLSVDANVRLAPVRWKVSPQILFGYSRLFETGHALDYGAALALPRWWTQKDGKSLRLELRDYWTFANPSQHNVMLRLGWMIAEYGD